MVRVAVIGSGIKGAATAALMAHCTGVEVVVHEAGDGPSGATATNHGRLHLGTAGFSSDSVELMARRQRGSQLWREFGVGGDGAPGVYLFDEAETLAAFDTACAAASIATRPARALPPAWVGEHLAAREVLEYGFDPMQVTHSLRAMAQSQGAIWRSGSPVSGVDVSAGLVRVDSPAGSDDFDLVLNCAGRWAGGIAMGWRDSPLFDTAWFIWQIMAAPAAQLPALDRVVVHTRANGEHASVVPHADVITLDFKSDPDPAPVTPAPGPTPVLRPVHRGDRYLQTCIQAFPALAQARDVYSFQGIQGRVRGARPGSIGTLYSDPDVPGYLVTQGGQASTALLDSLEVLQRLWIDDKMADDPYIVLGRLLRNPRRQPDVPGPFMAWEERLGQWA